MNVLAGAVDATKVVGVQSICPSLLGLSHLHRKFRHVETSRKESCYLNGPSGLRLTRFFARASFLPARTGYSSLKICPTISQGKTCTIFSVAMVV